MNDFNKNVKKVPGPKLKNNRNNSYSSSRYDNCATYISRNINTNANRR